MALRLPSLKAAFAGGLVLLHISAALLSGATPVLKDRLWPLVRWYAEGLCMITTWGMFARPPATDDMLVIGEPAHGGELELSSSVATRRRFVDRVVDVRLRKIQRKLSKADVRRELGREYLAYFCRLGAERKQPLERVHLRLVPARPSAERQPATLLSLECGERDSVRSAPQSGHATPAED
jgi:hypothetical protein